MYTHKDGLRARKLGSEDLLSLLELKSESWWGTHNTLIANIDDQKKWYEGIFNKNDQMYLIGEMLVNNNYVPVSVCCYTEIDWFNRSLNGSGSVLEKFREKKYVLPTFAAGLDFAFEIMNMQRVGGEILESNYAVQKIDLDYLGFKIEGRKRRAVFKAGRHYDSIHIGILKEEWENSQRVKNYGGCCNINFDHKLAEENKIKFFEEYKV